MKKQARIVQGFSLVEVALALAVVSFCLLTLMALLPLAVQRYHDADAQSAMVNVATMVARDLEATSSTGISPRFGFVIPAAGGSATTTPSTSTIYIDASGVATGKASPGTGPSSTSIYRASVYFTPPASGQRMATLARIWITFPANADASPATDAKNFADMFETTISLNRN